MKTLAIIMLVLIAAPVWAGDDCKPLDVYVRSAKIYMGAMQKIPDFKAAQKQLEAAIECYPEAGDPRYLMSMIYYRKRLYDKFLDMAKSLDTLEIEQKYRDTVWQMRRAAWGELFNRGVDSLKASNENDSVRIIAQQDGDTALFDSLTNAGRRYLESAKSLFLASLEMDSSRSEPFQNLGVIDVRLQNWDEALVWYRRSLEHKPGDLDLLRNLMSLNARLNQYDSAMQYANAVLVDYPDDLEAMTYVAGLYAEMGFPDSANIIFERIIATDPNNKDVLYNLSMTQVQNAQAFSDEISRHSQKANEYAQEYNKLAADEASQQKLKAIETKQRDAVSSLKETQSNAKEAWGKAEVLLKRFAGLDSTDYEVLYFLGLSQFWQEKYDEAAQNLERAVTLKADYCDAWAALRYTYLKSGKSDLANQAKASLDGCVQ